MSPWLKESDWWSGNSEAHPLTVGSAIILLVFLWIRITGARSLAGITIFDWILSVALGSTISRVITQPDLDFTRGVFSCLTIVLVDFLASVLYARVPALEHLIKPHPELLVFRGALLPHQLRRNRMTAAGVHQAMRTRGLTRLRDVEAVVLEGNGSLSTIPASDALAHEGIPDALATVPLYVQLRREWDKTHGDAAERLEAGK